MSAINNAWNGTRAIDSEAELDRKYQMAMQANTITGSTLTSSRTFDPSSDPYRTEVQVLIRKVENGYTARIDGKAYIASSIEELNGLVTVKLLALGGS